LAHPKGHHYVNLSDVAHSVAWLRAYTPTMTVGKIKQPRPGLQLDVLVYPKLAYTSTSTGSCVAVTIEEIILLMGQAASDAQPAVEARVDPVKPTAAIDVQASST
jgi:hypothetical protein